MGIHEVFDEIQLFLQVDYVNLHKRTADKFIVGFVHNT